MRMLRFFLTTGFFIISLTGCSSKVAEKKNFSGFLHDYSKLQTTDSPGGHPTLRWISPDYRSADYHGIYYTPVVYYPAKKPTARISQNMLDNLRHYVDSRFKATVGKRIPVVSVSGPGTLIMKTAITTVSTENQDIQFYEVVPIAALIAGTMAVSGYRTQNSVLYVEVQLSDAKTGKIMLEAVRKAYGTSVSNNSTPLTLKGLKKGVDEIINDMATFPLLP